MTEQPRNLGCKVTSPPRAKQEATVLVPSLRQRQRLRRAKRCAIALCGAVLLIIVGIAAYFFVLSWGLSGCTGPGADLIVNADTLRDSLRIEVRNVSHVLQLQRTLIASM